MQEILRAEKEKGYRIMLQQIIDIFRKYPRGTRIQLKDDYPNDIRIVSGYHPLFDRWYIDFEDGTMVCVDRLVELEIK